MIDVNTDDIELTDNWIEDDDTTRWRDYFPFTPHLGGGAEAENLTVVYFEIDEGNRLGTHTDSEEELLFVHNGVVEATIDDETHRLETGGMALVPANRSHSVRNVGDTVARCIGVFPGTTVTSTFEKPVQPFGQRVFGPEGDE